MFQFSLVYFYSSPSSYFLAFLALSSCLGDRVRARIPRTKISPQYSSSGRTYARGLGSGAGQTECEQIEREDVFRRVDTDQE
ncbi:hypothetical protein GQ43DRAFT_89652 [Delitschia confertaspora ATCC 74209]|uniref:Uncharacterized protein n=1 Tax=Delitschia confertaspora ATCC 74209 TaxID=1513339 RepID=A0A9P4MUH4_9PLEO|nr:hypothetical protein GQ43DRAFT_89652 [Delitschia confertaspora ATCC 74209]